MFKPEINTRDKDKGEKKEYPVEEQRHCEQNSKLRFKVRFDYKGKPKPARFFFGAKKTEEVAHEIREQQVALWRNIPLQGIYVEDIDVGDMYSIYDEEMEEEIAFAPLELLVNADSLEDLLCFIIRDEFRKIEILHPQSIMLNSKETEKLLFKINEIMQNRLAMRFKVNSR